MPNRKQQIINNVEKDRSLILNAERWLWAHPQTGYGEWEAHEYLAEKFESMGYVLQYAGNIPGFVTDLDTGHAGPTLCIMAELDALDIENHPESVDGMTHCCGHHAQGAAMLGIAAALRAPGALDGLSGRIRLMVVPAEELIQLTEREQMRKEGRIKYFGGKVEFMHRGFFDDVDLALMVHGSTDLNYDFTCDLGSNGCMLKTIRYKGKSAHAGGYPQDGVNAEYAALLGLQACNNLRETFPDSDHVRFHPILLGVNSAVNIIPDEMKIESYVRAASMEAMKRENQKINRALTGAALAMGAGVELCDRPGYSPEVHDLDFMKLVQECCSDLVGEDRINFDYNHWTTSSSDFGDLTCVMPGIQFYACGASGTLHGIDFCVSDPERLCVNAAKAQLLVVDALLGNDADAARRIVAGYQAQYPSITAYLKAVDALNLDKDAVTYDENGIGHVDYSNDIEQ